MQFRITIDCDNEAFEDENGESSPAAEIQRILSELAKSPFIETAALRSREAYPHALHFRDSNGNTVGKAEFIDA